MAKAIATTQNQNAQLTKTFIAAFAGVLLAVPIVTIMTTAIVKAQLGAVADSVVRSINVQPTSQQNKISTPTACVQPESSEDSSETAQANSVTKPAHIWKSGGVLNSYNQTNTSTVTNNSTVNKKTVIKKTYNDSFNVGSNNGNNNVVDSNNGNFSNNGSNNTSNSNNGNFANNGNTVNSNNNIGNTVNSGNVIDSGNVVNSGNTTINNDNDLFDLL